MRKIAVVAALLAAGCGHKSSSKGGGSGLWVTGYYPAYTTDTAMPIAEIPFGSMTHVVHFSLVPAADGTLTDPYGAAAQSAALVAAAHAKGVKVLLGVGGDTGSGATAAFQAAAASPATRATLVSSIVSAAASYDGVDLNWESIRFPDDVASFQALAGELRAALGGKLFTYPAGTASGFTDYGNLAAMLAPVAGDFDQINLQTYVMAGPFPGWVTWFNSPISAGACQFPSGGAPPSIESTVQPFLDAGIPPSKLGIGLQLAAVDWQGGSGTATGGVAAPCQSWDMSASAPDGQDIGAPDYSQVAYFSAAYAAATFTAANGWTSHFDAPSSVPWLAIDAAGSANDHFVSLEDAQSIGAKADWVRSAGLGGTIVFDVTGDYLPGGAPGDARHPLMTAVRGGFLP